MLGSLGKRLQVTPDGVRGRRPGSCTGRNVRRSVAVPDEKALLEFQAIGRPEDGIVQPVRVEVLDCLPHPLFVVLGAHQLLVSTMGEPALMHGPIGSLGDETKEAKRASSRR